jgi:hypothetical protein
MPPRTASRRRAAPSARLPLLLGLLAMAPLAPASAQPATALAGGALCRAAVAQAEREAGPALPARLLSAIARVESGRRDPATGQPDPWPWTINAEGRGSFFPDKAAAIAAVRALQAQGVRSIDVGCMQVNLRHHPNAFASLEQAFDPLANARYALRFLQDLHAGPAGGDWMRAASFYHSQTPELAEAYRGRVVAALAAERGMPSPPPVALAAAAAAAPGWPSGAGGFGLSNRSESVAFRPSLAGGPGRGLDAYRAAPIPLTGRIVAASVAATAPAMRPTQVALRPSAVTTPSMGSPPGGAPATAPFPPGAAARPTAPLLPVGARPPLIPGLPRRS